MNLDPVLVCDRCGRATLHIFAERRPHPRVPGEESFVDLIYACNRCGALRPWGSEPREETAYGRRLAKVELTHAIDAHGMRRVDCPACRGTGFDCSECRDDGQIWIFAVPRSCGPRCPLAGIDGLVAE